MQVVAMMIKQRVSAEMSRMGCRESKRMWNGVPLPMLTDPGESVRRVWTATVGEICHNKYLRCFYGMEHELQL